MIACVRIPYFVAAIERQQLDIAAAIPIIVRGPGHQASRVYAVSAEAASAGVIPGIPLHQAMVLCPDARIVPATPSRYKERAAAVMRSLRAFSDAVELAPGPYQDGTPPPSTLISYLELAPLQPDELKALGQEIGRAIRQRTRLSAAIGIARNKITAYAAALAASPGRVRWIPPDHEAEFLSRQPITVLPMDEETARELYLLGIKTAGQLASLTASAVLARFGSTGFHLWRLAQGDDDRPVIPHHVETPIEAHGAFDEPITDRAALEAALTALGRRLSQRLRAKGLSAQTLTLKLELEDGARQHRAITLNRPTADADRIAATAIRLATEALSCGVVGIHLTLTDLRPDEPLQIGLFASETWPQQALSDALTSLRVHYGAPCFLQVAIIDPEARPLERRFQLREARP